MRKKTGVLLMIFFTLASACKSFAQDSIPVKRSHIAVFAPLYLDSAFDRSLIYRYGTNFPKFFNAGLEFYEGLQLAVDSLDKENIPLDVHVYDSRSPAGNIASIVNTNVLDSMDLIIGHVSASEVRMLANAAVKKNIPFINATYPNDAGVSNNPNFVILNSTLYTHCSAIYKFIQKNYALSPIVLFRKKGAQDNILMEYFNEISKTTASVPLKIKMVTLENNFVPDDLKKHLNADRPTVCITGNLDVAFGELLTQQLSSLYETYPSVVFAMPTWWDATDFTKPEYKSVEVIFSTPFYMSPTDKLVVGIQNIFKTKFFSRPTDMVFRGYETMYHFTHLLQLNGKNLNSSFSDKRFRVFTDFDIQPVIDPKTNTLDYFENKKIYFIKEVDGLVTEVY